METERHEIGMIGLGVMGRNMLLNMADHGFPVAGYDSPPVDSLIADRLTAGVASGCPRPRSSAHGVCGHVY